MWIKIWQWCYENYIFHTVCIVAIFYLILFPDKLRRIFGKFKKIKAGAFELQTGDEIDPNTPCPYKKSRDISFGAIRDVEGKVDIVDSKVNELSKELNKIMMVVTNMSIDAQKSYFYDESQPDAERLAAGLKYIYQGGNGHTKPDVVKFAEAHKEIYNALTSVKPELRLIYDK